MHKVTTLLLSFVTYTLFVSAAHAQTCSAEFEMTVSDGVAEFDGSGTGIAPLYYFWDFGDGSAGSGEDPVHTYYYDGWYWACLSVYAADSCIAYVCDTVVITDAPGGIDSTDCAAAFEFTVTGTTVYFENTSDDGGADVVSWYWVFGDGSTSISENPVHTFPTGVWTVCLTMTTADGCTSTACEVVYIVGGIDTTECTAGFTVSIEDAAATFTNTSDGGGAFIYSYFWEMGDGGMSADEDPVYTYAAPGVYTVCLTIYTTDSCYSTYCNVITIAETPDTTGICDAYFVWDFGITPFAIFTTNLSDDGGDGDPSYSWDFGDGGTSTDVDAAHVYATGGFYNVCLTIYTDSCTDTYCTVVEISTGISSEVLTEVNVYPVPANDHIVVALPHFGYYQFEVVDMQGQLIYSEQAQVHDTHSINTSSLAEGSYFLFIHNDAQQYMHAPFIVLRK